MGVKGYQTTWHSILSRSRFVILNEVWTIKLLLGAPLIKACNALLRYIEMFGSNTTWISNQQVVKLRKTPCTLCRLISIDLKSVCHELTINSNIIFFRTWWRKTLKGCSAQSCTGWKKGCRRSWLSPWNWVASRRHTEPWGRFVSRLIGRWATHICSPIGWLISTSKRTYTP